MAEDLSLRPAIKDDLSWFAEMEKDAELTPFLYSWGIEKHLKLFADTDYAYFVIGALDERRIGMVILAGLDREDRTIELVRLAIAEPGRGLGSKALQAVKKLVFKDWKKHRLWLDVFEDHRRAQRAYEKAGFRSEGLLREAAEKQDGSRASLIIMGLLASEAGDG